MIVVVYYPDSTSHLAIGLTGLGKEKNIYISFFPGNEKSIAGFRLHELRHDRQHHASTVVILPTEESCGYGLSEQAIYDWWKNDFKPNSESFGWFNNNCSSIVYRALCVGQKGSTTLSQDLMLTKTWFCTPTNVLSYAIDLKECILKKQTIQNGLALKYAELRELCELGKLKDAYTQALALYLRIKKFNIEEYNLILNKQFCELIKSVLSKFAQQLPGYIANDTAKELLSRESENHSANYELYFLKLMTLMDDILSGISTLPEKKNAHQILENAIKQELLSKLANYLDTIAPANFVKPADVKNVLATVESVIDSGKNPHKNYVQQSDPMPNRTGPMTFSRMPL